MKSWMTILPMMLLASCQKENNTATIDPPAITHRNVAYGTHPKQVMDIYLPEKRNSNDTKVMILIHGGAWSSGDKSDFTIHVDTLKKRLPDYAIFNINYRIASMTGDLFPSQEDDVKAAFEFILNKSSEYKVSQKIAILGASAGGHLALLQGYKNSSAVKPKVIVDFFGPTDMAALHASSPDPSATALLEILMSGSPGSNPGLYHQSSSINFVTDQSPPTIILHGGMDPLVPVSQSTALVARLQSQNVPHEYILYPTEGHEWHGANLTHSFNAIQAFLAIHLP
jgi:acetyl esterase/lipase